MSDWKPGDVAATDWGTHAFRTEEGWTYQDGSHGSLEHDYHKNRRPLVVIDPDNAEHMTRLAEAWDNVTHATLGDEAMPLRAYRMQAALREFANPTPPRPDEPQGLGAVVEDAEGNKWVRNVPTVGAFIWRGKKSNGTTTWRRWDDLDIPADGVLSEGVQ